MKDFDIAKYLREHQLGSYGILNHYVDLKPIKEEITDSDLDKAAKVAGNSNQDIIDRLKKLGYSDKEILAQLAKLKEDVTPEEMAEIPYEGPDDKLTGLGDGDSFDQAEIVSEAADRVKWKDLHGTDLEVGGMEIEIDDIIDDTQKRIEKYVAAAGSENPMQTDAQIGQIRSLIKKLWMQKIQSWSGSNRGMEEIYGGFNTDPSKPSAASRKFIGGSEAEDNTEILAKAIEALSKAGLTLDQIKAVASTIENDPETLEQALAFE